LPSERVSVVIDAEEHVSEAARKAKEAIQGVEKTTKESTKQSSRSALDLASAIYTVRSAYQTVSAVARTAWTVVQDVTSAYYEQEKAITRVNAVLRATGKSATISSEYIKQLGAQFQATTMFGDDLVENAAAIALTFDEISETTLPRVLSVASDLATMFGTDLVSATRDLGVALEDPEAGLTRLRRAGVVFDEQAKAMIKTLVEQGDTVEAQNKLLEELERRVGGVAEAMGDTAAGKVTQLANAFGDLKEEIGGILAELAKPGMEKLTELLQGGTAGLSRMRLTKMAETLSYGQAASMSSDELAAMHQAATEALANAIMWRTLTPAERAFQTAAFGSRASDAQYWDNIVDRLTDMIESAMQREEALAKVVSPSTGKPLPVTVVDTGYDPTKNVPSYYPNFDLVTDLGYTPLEYLGQLFDETEGDTYALGEAVENTVKWFGALTSELTAFNSEAEWAQVGFQKAEGAAAAGGLQLTEYGSPEEMRGPSALAGVAGQLAGAFMDMLQSITSIKLLLDPISTILDATLSIIGPLVDQALAPLVGILVVVGELLGTMLAPVIEFLTPIIEAVSKAFLWLYNNIIRPVGQIIYSMFVGLTKAVVGIVNAVIDVLNLLRLPSNQLEHWDYNPASAAEALPEISYGDLIDKGGTAISHAGTSYGTSGSQTTVEHQPDIYVYLTIQGSVWGAGGPAEVGREMARALEAYAGIGGRITIVES